MYCPQCAQPNEDSFRFCQRCGKPLPPFHPHTPAPAGFMPPPYPTAVQPGAQRTLWQRSGPLGRLVMGSVGVLVGLSCIAGLVTAPQRKSAEATATAQAGANAQPVMQRPVAGRAAQPAPTPTQAQAATPMLAATQPRPTATPTSPPTATPVPPTATPVPLVGPGTTTRIGNWELVVWETVTTGDFGVASGMWVVVRGAITNRGDAHLIGKQELKLQADDLVLDLDRDASGLAAEHYEVVHIGRLGGESAAQGTTIEWAIAFDVPRDTRSVTLLVDDHPAVALGMTDTFIALPTATPPPDVGTEAGAIDVCKQAVKEQLVHPSTAEFPWLDYTTYQLDATTWKVVSTVSAKNAFNLELTYTWSCVTYYEGNRVWGFKEVYLIEE